MGNLNFDADKEIPDLSGKVIFITGGTAGLGEASVIALAKHKPAHIYFSGRNAKSADSVVKGVRESGSETPITFVECDLASLASVKAAAERFLADESRLDILMCNAGIMAVPAKVTTDGYEVQFGTNHVGHALLIKKLLPLLSSTAETPGADVRIVSLTSSGFRLHPKTGIIFKDLKSEQDLGAFGPWKRYGQSKLANILYARELARRYPSILTVSIHPGVVSTGLVNSMSLASRALIISTNKGKLLTPSEGAYNQLWAATADKGKLENGQFYEPVGILSKSLDKVAKDDALAAQLWEWTEKELEEY